VRSVVVARADEIAPGERMIVEIGGRSVGVFDPARRQGPYVVVELDR
jgi:hypothetical protein